MSRLSVLTVFVSIFALLAWTLLARDPPNIAQSDQVFYHSIAYDLHHYGVFSNGIWGPAGNENEPPPPGMMYVPLYPLLISAVMRADARFAEAIGCPNQLRRDPAPRDCLAYTAPMMIIHALLLAIGILAVSVAGYLIIPRRGVFVLTAALATGGIFSHAELFTYLMTESISFCLYSVAMLAFIFAVQKPRSWAFAMAGATLGLLVLARPAFAVLVIVLPLLIAMKYWNQESARWILTKVLILAACFQAVLLPWQIRNYASVGKFGLSEEYGAVNIISRFGYNQMTLRDGLLAFPAALPQVGVAITRTLFGETEKSGWGWEEDSLYGVGSRKVFELRHTYGSLDSVFWRVTFDELRQNWWRYALTTIPIAWTGLWVGKTWGLIFIPIFAVVLGYQLRNRPSALLFYSAPALVMVVVHAALSNHSVRFNMGLIGPVSVGAAYFFLYVVFDRFLTRYTMARQSVSS